MCPSACSYRIRSSAFAAGWRRFVVRGLHVMLPSRWGASKVGGDMSSELFSVAAKMGTMGLGPMAHHMRSRHNIIICDHVPICIDSTIVGWQIAFLTRPTACTTRPGWRLWPGRAYCTAAWSPTTTHQRNMGAYEISSHSGTEFKNISLQD